MFTTRIVAPLALAVSVLGGPVTDQGAARPPGGFRSLEDLNASYNRQLVELDRHQIADLAILASKAEGAEADAAYAQLFHLAVARDLCREALPAAERCLATKTSGRELRALANFVRIAGRADQGDYDRSLDDLKALLRRGGSTDAAAEADMALAVGEAYLQRLIRAGRYDVARKLCEMACEDDAAPATLKDHFEARMDRLELLGKVAPPIGGADVDGKKVSLADLKGKVVLVDFWATWCPPCVAAIPRLNALAAKYHDRGFEVLGINVDAMHEDVKGVKAALPVVRRFLAEHGVTWTNLLDGEVAGGFAKAYGVEDVPANFLIGRDGKVIGLELSGEDLERAISRAVGDEAGNARR